MRIEVTNGVSRIARAGRFCCVRCCLFQAASVQLFRFFSLSVVFVVMTARQTNNSLAVALSSFDAPSAPVSSTNTSGTSSFVSSQSSESVVVSSPLVSAAAPANLLPTASTDVLSPDLVSLINQTVHAAVQASQRQPGPAIAGPISCPGTSSSSASLGGLASTFFAAGTGFQPSLPSSSTSGRLTPLVVPTFVSTFNAPVPAIVSSSGQALSGVSAQFTAIHCTAVYRELVGGSAVRRGPGLLSRSCQARYANQWRKIC